MPSPCLFPTCPPKSPPARLIQAHPPTPPGEVAEPLNLWGDERRTQYERVRYEFDELAKLARNPQPTFAFAHFLTPHPDYVFNSDGSFLELKDAVARGLETRYLDQLVATNALVEDCIEALLAESDNPPIIILQSDEGPYPDFMDGFTWTNGDCSDSDLRVKAGIINAYYFPSGEYGQLYSSISPVNSFRLVFDLFFGANLELLPDRSYYWHPGQPYRFIDMTARLQDASR